MCEKKSIAAQETASITSVQNSLLLCVSPTYNALDNLAACTTVNLAQQLGS